MGEMLPRSARRGDLEPGAGKPRGDSDTNLGMTLGAGYRKGKLDLHANLLFPAVSELGDELGLTATIGYCRTTL